MAEFQGHILPRNMGTTGAAGAVSGAGAAGEVAYWSGASTITGSPNFLFDPSTGIILQANENHASTFVGPIIAEEYYSLSGLTQPFTNYDPSTYGAIELSGAHGGIFFTGLSNNGKSPLQFRSVVGGMVLDAPAINFVVTKANGSGGTTSIGTGEVAQEVNNGGGLPIWDIFGNGEQTMGGTGFSTGFARLSILSPANIAGTGTIFNNSGANGGTILGTATAFTTQLVVGDKIIALGAVSTVRSIADDTHMTVDYPGNWPDATSFTIAKPVFRILDSSLTLQTATYPTGGITATNYHSTTAGSLLKIGEGNIPGLGFGFLDPAFNHALRSAGGSNQDIILDVFGTTVSAAAHYFGINGFFKTGYGVVIGDNTFASVAPVNGLKVIGEVNTNSFTTTNALAAPAVSAGATGRIYFDSGSNTYKASENGGAYRNLLSPAIISGTNALTAGTVTISAAITANSRILVTVKDANPGAGGLTIGFEAPAASRNVGAGTFVVRANVAAGTINTLDTSTFDWLVIG